MKKENNVENHEFIRQVKNWEAGQNVLDDAPDSLSMCLIELGEIYHD